MPLKPYYDHCGQIKTTTRAAFFCQGIRAELLQNFSKLFSTRVHPLTLSDK